MSPAMPTSIATAPTAISVSELRRLSPSHGDGPWAASWRRSASVVLRTRAPIAWPNIVKRPAISSSAAQAGSGTTSAATRRTAGTRNGLRRRVTRYAITASGTSSARKIATASNLSPKLGTIVRRAFPSPACGGGQGWGSQRKYSRIAAVQAHPAPPRRGMLQESSIVRSRL